MPSASRDMRSISTVRIRASDQEAMGGYRGMEDMLPEERRNVRALKVRSVRMGALASRAERLL